MSGAGWSRVGEQVWSARTWELLGNSLALVFAVTLTAVAVGSTQAFFVVKTDLRFRQMFAMLAVFPLAIPSYVAAYTWLAAFPGFQGFGAAWLVLSMGTAPYVFLAVSAALLLVDSSLEEVARSLGRGQWGVVRSVVWPAARPAAVGAALVVALYTLSDFGAVSLLRFDTFTRGIFNAYRSSFDRTSAAVLGLIVVVASVSLVLLQRRLAPTVNSTAKSRRRTPLRLESGRAAAYAVLLAIAAVGVGVPLSSLVRWSALGVAEADWAAIGRALLNTGLLALSSAAVASVVALGVALVVYRYQPRWAAAVDWAVWIGHALPGVVVALAFVFVSNSLLPGLYQTSLLVVIAYTALFTPNAVAALSTPIRQLPTALDDVARTLGARPLGVLGRVLLPALRPALVTSASLLALTVIKELPATLLLRPTGIETLATRLWTQTSISAFSSAAPYALLLVLLAGVPALLLNQQVRRNFAPAADSAGQVATEAGAMEARR